MNYSEIKFCDIANGAGVRTTLFVSGCRHHCPHCFNPGTWAFDAGEAFTRAVSRVVLPLHQIAANQGFPTWRGTGALAE